MGTNYYLHRDSLDTPTKEKDLEPIHLGKKSCGWKFLFQKSDVLYDKESLMKLLKSGNIYDEYDRYVSIPDFLSLLEEDINDKSDNRTELIDGYRFLEGDFVYL